MKPPPLFPSKHHSDTMARVFVGPSPGRIILTKPRRPCVFCGKPYDESADGSIRAHFLKIPRGGKKRCPGGRIPPGDPYEVATHQDIRRIDDDRLERAERRTFEPREASCCVCERSDCACYLAGAETL